MNTLPSDAPSIAEILPDRGDQGASRSIFKFGLSYIRVFLKESWMALVAFSGVVALEAIAAA
jgi:hypothetical protein